MIIVIILILLSLGYLATLKPSNDRDWSLDQDTLPYVEVDGDIATFYNVRNFNYRSEFDYDRNYDIRSYDLNKITSLDYIVVPFGSIGAAHTFLSFGFEDGQQLAVSIEIRKEKGESFSGIKGIFKQFELMYIVADETDVIRLRTNFRNNDVYLYPAVGKPETHKLLLLDIIRRINELKDTPEFYSTITNNCTTNIADHVNITSDVKIHWNLNLFLPKNSDRFARDIGLLNVDPNLSIEEMRAKYYISDKAKNAPEDASFEKAIRGLE